MRAIKQISLIFLTNLLLFPSAVKLEHFFSNHQHVYCDHNADSHLHQETLNCDLFKFQQTPIASLGLPNFEFLQEETESRQPVSAYHFLSEYQKSPFGLRGPPILI